MPFPVCCWTTRSRGACAAIPAPRFPPADRIWAYRDTTDVLRIVYGPFVYFMAVTLALAGLIHLYKMLERR